MRLCVFGDFVDCPNKLSQEILFRLLKESFDHCKKRMASLTLTRSPGLRRFREKQMLVILIFILFGDSFKFGQILGLNKYNWMQGHFADTGLPAQFTTTIYYLTGHTRTGRIVAIAVPPLLFTIYEFTQAQWADTVDIACYFIGSLAAMVSICIYKQIAKS
ncbi:MAG: hypothetical protein ACE5HS_22230 [bacterium]